MLLKNFIFSETKLFMQINVSFYPQKHKIMNPIK